MYDRRAGTAAPHWMQCASEVTSGGVMVRAAPANRRVGTPYGPGKAHDGNDEATPRRNPALPAWQPVQATSSPATGGDVRRARSGDARQVRPRRHPRRGGRRRRARGLRAATAADPGPVRQADQAVTPLGRWLRELERLTG